MDYCKHGLCLEKAEHYCPKHGGEQRWIAEQQRKAEREIAQQQPKPGAKPFFTEKPKGQAVPTGQGLSKDRDPSMAMWVREEKRKKRADKEAKRDKLRAERLAARPSKGKGGKSRIEGTGGSKKSRQQRKKNRKRGATGGSFKSR